MYKKLIISLLYFIESVKYYKSFRYYEKVVILCDRHCTILPRYNY